MSHLIQWIDHRCKLLGIRNQGDLADISGASRRTISRIFTDGTLGEANRSTRIWLARTLKITLRELEALNAGTIKSVPDDRIVEWEHCGVSHVTHDASFATPVADIQGGGIPIIGRVAAGGMVESFEDWNEETGLRLPVKLPGAQRVYALEIDGDSMEPLYLRGEYVILQDIAPEELRDGEDVMIQLNGDSDGKAAFKRVYLMGGGRIKLVSLNPKYPPADISAPHVIRVGRLAGKFTPPKIISKQGGNVEQSK